MLSLAVRREGAVKIISQSMSDWFSVLIVELSVEQSPTWPGSATDTRYSPYTGLLLPPEEGCGLWKRTYIACWQKKSIDESFNAILVAYHMWHMSCVTWNPGSSKRIRKKPHVSRGWSLVKFFRALTISELWAPPSVFVFL